MKALTPVPPHSGRQVSPLTSPCLPGIPTPTTQSARWPLGQSHQRHRLLPGFATNEQARHEITPKQVRYPTDCQFASRCSPPRLAATQLRSASELRPAPARTSTVPTKRPRGAHSPPRKPGGGGIQRPGASPRARLSIATLAAMDARVRGHDNVDSDSESKMAPQALEKAQNGLAIGRRPPPYSGRAGRSARASRLATMASLSQSAAPSR